MKHKYCPAGYRPLPTGMERRLPNGRTYQAHGPGAKDVLERVDG